MSLLVMCSTKRRPEECKRMLNSFIKTKSKLTKICVYISNEDPCLKEYEKMIKEFDREDIIFLFSIERKLVEVLNFISTEQYPDYEFYAEVNDDHIYLTQGWDEALMDMIKIYGGGWGLACGRDLVDDDWFKLKHPSAFVMSGNIVRTLGYFTYPKIEHFGSDFYHKDIGEGIARLFHNLDVVIEHRCFTSKKVEADENYKWVYSGTQQHLGYMAYQEWVEEAKKSDLAKLRDAILRTTSGLKIIEGHWRDPNFLERQHEIERITMEIKNEKA